MENAPSESQQEPARIVSQAVVIDFDRTIVDSDKCLGRLIAVANEFHVDTDPIVAKSKRVVDTGGSFDPLKYVKAALTQEQMESFEYEFIHAEGESLVYDDVMPFMQMLDDNAIPYAVLTHGVSKEWQELKIKASGYRGPYRIIDHREKAKEIADLQAPDASYLFSSLYEHSPQSDHEKIIANTICLIDDKAVAFNDLPPSCMGYLLVRGEKRQKSQQGKIPWNTVRISSFGNLEAVNHQIQFKQNMALAA
jgi:hypothetical protein